MTRLLKTVKLLFWGNLAVILIGVYMLFVVLIGITEAFLESLQEIWSND